MPIVKPLPTAGDLWPWEYECEGCGRVTEWPGTYCDECKRDDGWEEWDDDELTDLPAVPPEAYEAALAKWHERAAAGTRTSPEEHVAALVDAAAPFLVAEGRRQAAAEIGELQQRWDRHMWGHDWRPSGVDGAARCRHCSFGKEGEPSSHQMSCRLYEGPLRHEWLGYRARTNPTFGGVDYYCICGGWFRRGGMAGHGDGTATAEPVCPNAGQTWRGAARIAEGNTDATHHEGQPKVNSP